MICLEIYYKCIKIATYIKNKVIADTFSINSEADIVNALRLFVKTNKIASKNISIVLKEEKIFKRFETYKFLSDKDIKSLVKNNAKEMFPIDIKNYVLDYEILSKDDKNTHIMIVAVPNYILEKYLDVIDNLGFTCVSVDFYQNCVSKKISKVFKNKTLVVHEMFDKTSFIYMEQGIIIKMRDVLLDLGKDAKNSINQGLGFYLNEIYEINDMIFLDDNPYLITYFENYNFEIYDKVRLGNFLETDVNYLALDLGK